MAKATIVSLLPYPLVEHIQGYIPSDFLIPAATETEPGILVIDDAYYMEYFGEDKGSRRFAVAGPDVAKDLVEAYNRNALAVQLPMQQPGLFYLSGEPDLDDIIDEPLYEQYRDSQNQWFKALLELGDDMWQKYHTHLAVPDICRKAATALSADREWNLQVKGLVQSRCPFCMSFVSSLAAICANCKHVVNKELYDTLTQGQEIAS